MLGTAGLAFLLAFNKVPTFKQVVDKTTLRNNKETKAFIDYFMPTPIQGELTSKAWGAPQVGPRDQSNGLEDTS